MEKKNIDWENLSFSYQAIDQRYVADYVDGAWQPGHLSSDPIHARSLSAGRKGKHQARGCIHRA